MNEQTLNSFIMLDSAIFEAERFIQKAKQAKVAFKCGAEDNYRSPAYASAKRSSMDLSRALVKLRKPYDP